MYAIIATGGKQYRVENGSVLNVERILADGQPFEAGKKLVIRDVLLVGDGTKVTIGQPTVANASVELEVVGEVKDDKKLSFKKLKRQGKQWKKGHRQKLTRIRVTKISA